MNDRPFRLAAWAPELSHYQRNDLRRRYRRARRAGVTRDAAKWQAVRRVRAWVHRRPQ